jgi:hypothetical protein
VLTPPPIIAAIVAGYRPLVHPTALTAPELPGTGAGADRRAVGLLETQVWPVAPKLMSWWWAPVLPV